MAPGTPRGSRARSVPALASPARRPRQCAVALLAQILANLAYADPAPPAAANVSGEVVVTANKLAVQTLIDRKVYSVASDVAATFGTVTDLLGNIPSVEVDADGAVALRGDSNVLILIDGRPSAQLSGPNAGENLQQIPAQDIERIEVYTSPPPQFKAEGAAGVINIVMRKKRPAGPSGTLQASAGSDRRSVVGASGADVVGPWAMAASAGLRTDYRDRRVRSDTVAPDPVTGASTESRNSIDETIRRSVPLFKLSVDCAVDEQQSWRAAATRGVRSGNRYYTQLGSYAPAGGPTNSESERMSAGHDWSIDSDQEFDYSRKLPRTGETLDLRLHRSINYQREHYDYRTEQTLPQAAFSLSNLSLSEDTISNELALDYLLPVAASRTLLAGYDYERDTYRYGNAGNNVDPMTGGQIADPNLTNDFKVIRQVHAAYASYQATLRSWTWLGGLRVEETDTDAMQLTNGLEDRRSYWRVYPNLHAERSLSDTSTLSFAASRRVTRPDPSTLNPYVDREYTPNLRAGNPGLLPQDTRAIEAGYGIEAAGLSYTLTGYFRRNLDSVTDVTQYLGKGFTLTTKANLARNDAAGVEFTANGRLTGQFGYGLSGNLFHSQIDARALGTPGLRTTSGVNAKLKLDYHPTPADSAQISATRSDRRLTPQGYVSAINVVNLGYRHQFPLDLAAVVTVSDLFNGQVYRRYTSAPALREDYERSVRGRILYAGLMYAFGTPKKKKTATFDYDQ